MRVEALPAGAPAGARRVLLLATAVAVSLAALSGCALAMLSGAAGSGTSTSSRDVRTDARITADEAITSEVKSKLNANPALQPFNFVVDTHDGVVTLRGQVAKVEQRDAAQVDAGAVKGVKRVQNLLTVP